MSFFWVAIGGSLGAVLRYATTSLSLMLFGNQLPYGTWLANMLGCFAAGWVLVWIGQFQSHASEARAFILIGVLGAYTTFSAFSLETLQMLNDGHMKLAFTYAGLSLSGCFTATAVGFILAKQYFA